MLPWLLCGMLAIAVLLLCLKIMLLHHSVDEICVELGEILGQDTNCLITISSRDRQLRHLAAELNTQLRLLRKQRWQYLNGDRELKEAVTNISHDLRTPLTAICGYLDLLERAEKSSTVARYLALVANRTQALQQLTEELFRYSVIASTSDKLSLEAVNVNRVLEESLAAFYAIFKERGISPVIHIPQKQVVRMLNHEALARVFSNILYNASKYSDGDLIVSLLDEGQIIFTNTASKLDEIEVGKLFNRFFTVEAARNSTGLGLAIARTLVEQMNGQITAAYTADQKLSICVGFGNDIEGC